MIFDIPFMISHENFENRTVIQENGLVGNISVTQLWQFFSAQDSSHSFITRLQKVIFSVPYLIVISTDREY